MKHLLLLTLTLLTAPLCAGVNCINNSENLEKPCDTKEWHSVACDCPCDTIKNDYCVECGHLQRAHPLIIVTPEKTTTAVVQNTKIHTPDNPETVLKKLAARYLMNK